MPASTAPDGALAAGVRRRLGLQMAICRLASPLTLPAAWMFVRWGLGLRISGAGEARRVYQELTAERGPLLVCANHLTLFDSALVASALGSPGWFFRHFRALPWNVPEERNFASTWLRRALAYVYKCVPVRRGGDRAGVAGTLERFIHLLATGESGLLFPEGGRSRSGRVEMENAAYGVGRIVKSLPGCRVLCVYVRGERQRSWSSVPERGERLHVQVGTLEPKSDHAGLRGSRDIARQITTRLIEMEQAHFAEHPGSLPGEAAGAVS